MQDDHPWLRHLETLHHQAIDLNLERIQKVGEKGGLFDLDCKVVLVAGTNGKGTTVFALEKLLTQSGLSMGCYTSPHLVSFNERIQINGKLITDQALIEAFEVVEALRDNVPLTFFEFTTLAAFHFFKVNSPDILLAEIGLGGRLDAVNCLTPDLSIITSIGYDHQSWLGTTLEEIAAEKAGILRKNTPCVIGKDAQLPCLVEIADSLNCSSDIGGINFDWVTPVSKTETDDEWRYHNQQYTVPEHHLPANSVSIALASYIRLTELLKLPAIEKLVDGLHHASMRGRFYTVSQSPEIIVDVAHNIDSCRLLKERLMRHVKTGRRFALWAMLNDKDINNTAHLFRDIFDAWYVPVIHSERAYTQDRLVESLEMSGIYKIFRVTSTKLAYEELLKKMNRTDQMVVFGSFYTVSEFLKYFEQAADVSKTELEKQSIIGDFYAKN